MGTPKTFANRPATPPPSASPLPAPPAPPAPGLAVIALIALALATLLLAAGCGGGGGGSDSGGPDPGDGIAFARSDLPRELSPSASASEMSSLAEGNASFAADLYRNIRSSGSSNIVLSPLSISRTMALLYAGAGGRTRYEMAEALHFILPGHLLHPAFNALALALEARRNAPVDDGLSPPRIDLADALWAPKTLAGADGSGAEADPADTALADDYLDLLATHYGAGVGLADFAGAPEAARAAINEWIADRTGGRITDLLPAGSITPLTRLALTQTLHLTGHWETPFSPEATRTESFTTLSGATVSVAMMTRKDLYPYASGPDYQAVEIPLAGNHVSMVVALPAAGRLAAFESGLTGDGIQAMFSNLYATFVRIHLPRFDLAPAALSLSGTLSAMGMPTAFSDAADFSAMAPAGNLRVSETRHQAFMAVDEDGVTAGAATGAIVGPISGEPAATVRADRPFLFFIRDIPTGAILFMGRVTDPTASG